MAAEIDRLSTPSRLRRRVSVILLLTCVVWVTGLWAVDADETPTWVTYGPLAARGEGDPDSLQILYFSLPAEQREAVYLRIFDADTGGAFDTAFGRFGETLTRFALYSGPQAFQGAHRGDKPAVGKAAIKGQGFELATWTIGEDATVDAQWHTLTKLDPAAGALVDGRRVFRLEVEGLEGNDANVFDLAVSTLADANHPPPGLRLFSYEPTLRLFPGTQAMELPLQLPPGATTLSLSHFDLESGVVTFVGPFRDLALRPSGEGRWRTEKLVLEADEPGRRAAVVLPGGGSRPNDMALLLSTPEGMQLAFELPGRHRPPNARPQAAVRVTPQSCDRVAYDGAPSRDAEGEALSYRWRFADGTELTGQRVVREYPQPGEEQVRLEVSDSTGRIGSTTVWQQDVIIRTPPVARIEGPTLTAPGEEVTFSGRASSATDARIASYSWRFGDAALAEGAEVLHSFGRPGRYPVRLLVRDDSGHPCSSASAELRITVNAPPVARAGPDRTAAVGQIISLDASASTDPDGAIARYQWDFGDGRRASGPHPRVSYETPGNYRVRLTVTDDSHLGNSTTESELTVRVRPADNKPPVADAGTDRTIIAGDILRLDGSGSQDPDGNIIRYRWDFGDGMFAVGRTPTHRFSAAGTYKILLTVEDDSGQPNSKHIDEALITVEERPNQAPTAAAGGDQTATVGEAIILDGSGSSDADGQILSYEWKIDDGRRLHGIRQRVAFEQPGIYDVGLIVRDNSRSASDTASDTIRIRIDAGENLPPVADAGRDMSSAPGQTIRFDATGSRDEGGRVIDYVWDYGDGERDRGPLTTHAYTKPGSYRVTLTVADDGPFRPLTATDRLTVTVNAPPVARAGADLNGAVDQVLRFDAGASRDPDGEIIEYRWDLGDGNQATGRVVEHAFDAYGVYVATLTVKDDSGLANSEVADQVRIRINASPIADAGSDRTVAAGKAISFDGFGSEDADNNSLSFHWDFGDGGRSTLRSPVYAYRNPGSYRVRLTVDDNSGLANSSSVDDSTITVTDPPNARPFADVGPDRTVRLGEAVEFNGAGSTDSDGNLTAFAWDFGDGRTASGPAPTHTFRGKGVYPATLSVTDDSGRADGTAEDRARIRVIDPENAAPIAEATVNGNVDGVTSVVGETLRLDASTSSDPDGNLISFSWDLGNGFRLPGPTADYAYHEAGTYQVVLKINDDSGLPDDTGRDRLTVVVEPRPNQSPVAAAGSDRAVAVGEPIDFDPSASRDADGNIVSYLWDFGDGNYSSLIGPTHHYSDPGTYSATLSIYDDSRSPNHQDFDEVTIFVNDPPIAAAGPDQIVTASEVAFDGRVSSDSDGKLIAYEWDFGDGGRGSGIGPRHVYRRPGTYNVSLIVTDDSGTSTHQASDNLQVVINAPPLASINGPMIGAPGERLLFDAGASRDPDGQIADRCWKFGDGTTATGTRIEKIFERPGKYSVRLEVRDDTGHSSAVGFAEHIVKINASPVAVAGRDLIIAAGETVEIDGRSSYDPDGSLIAYFWEIPGQDVSVRSPKLKHTFEQPGRYRIGLTVRDNSEAANSEAQDELQVVVNGAPVANAGVELLTNERRIWFDGSESTDPDGDPLTYAWDFGDGNAASGKLVSHEYASAGPFQASLTVNDGTGASNANATASRSLLINHQPTAVSGERRDICLGDVINFDGGGSSDADGHTISYHWDFGDGTTATEQKSRKTFGEPGVYPVTLTVSDGTGLPNATHGDRIDVAVSDRPRAGAGPDIRACVNSPVQFDGSASTDLDGVVNSFRWDFGDGKLGGGITPYHTYARPGVFHASLTIEGDALPRCDNVATDFVRVEVVQGPIVILSAPTAAPVGTAVRFDASKSHADQGSIVSYRWDFGDGSSAEGATVEHRFPVPGDYRTTLTVATSDTSECGTVTRLHAIAINAPPVATARAEEQARTGQPVKFSASASIDPDGAIVEYRWDFGDGTAGAGMETAHIFAAPGTYNVVLTVRDDSGLDNASDTDALNLSITEPMTPQIVGPAVTCPETPALWKVRSDGESSSPDDFTWQFGNGDQASGASVDYAYAHPGRYDLSLIAGADGASHPADANLEVTVNAAPVAKAGQDMVACPGSAAHFDGAGSFDPDGRIVSVAWDFGDGSSSDELSPAHRYERPGIYEVRLAVTDDSGSHCAIDSDTLFVRVNSPPRADAGADLDIYTGGANDFLVLDGSGSSDPDGDDLSFHWQIGDETELSEERVRYRFRQPGEYQARLIVTDGTGLPCSTDASAITIRVQER